MTLREIIAWLQPCPALSGEALIPDFLPSHKGWSISADRQTVRTDILGRRSIRQSLKITRRITVPDSDARLTALEQLEAIVAWTRENPPPDSSIRLTGLPEFGSRASSGTEDFVLTLTLVSDG